MNNSGSNDTPPIYGKYKVLDAHGITTRHTVSDKPKATRKLRLWSYHRYYQSLAS